jgi:G8 domain
LIKVVGCLEFRADNTINQTLHAHQIFVFGGKLTIGSTLIPYTKKAIIMLYGNYDGSFITMPGATEAGNKMIANVGTIKMYGKIRSRMSRLTAPCQKGSSSCSVEPGLDWVAGDLLGFPPTATQWTHYEMATIQSYDATTGALVLDSALKFYHFGASTSTGANY